MLEFNVRFGDPETQAVLPRLRSDLLELLLAATRPGGLAGRALEWSARVGGDASCWRAPATPTSSSSVDRRPGASQRPRRRECPRGRIEVTHAGTARARRGVVTAGGRVLNVTALGADPASARDAAYAAAEMISFDGMQLRRDIAAHADDERTWTAQTCDERVTR